MAERDLHWLDYTIFILTLLSSVGIGVFYGFFGSKQKTTKEFLMANSQMSSFPVALSLMCSAVSAITLLGYPVEIYLYGTQYIFIILSFIPFNLSLAYLYIPVYFNLNIKFDKSLRFVISLLGLIHIVASMAIAVYAPALAINQVTGISTKLTTGIIYLVCIFYSSLGGLKAVLWTDVLQAFIMLASLTAITIKGVSDIGGLSVIWKRAEEGGRVEFLNFDPDPRTRHTVWTSIIGGYFFFIPFYAATQIQVQRFLSMPNIKIARRALFINLIGLVVIVGLCLFAGLVIFAKYHNCDPITAKIVSKSDQLVPHFVEETTRDVNGLLGLFVAGLVCASMSTLSSGITALASITTYDYVNKLYPKLNDTQLSLISKVNSAIFGVLSYLFVFAVEKMGNILPATSSLLGIIIGPVFGVFSLGIFFPWANTRGAIIGMLSTFGIMASYSIAGYLEASELPDQRLPLSTEECISEEYESFPGKAWKERDDSGGIRILSMSYLWNSLLGSVLSIVLGLLSSLAIRKWGVESKGVKREALSLPVLALWEKLLPGTHLSSCLAKETQHDDRGSNE